MIRAVLTSEGKHAGIRHLLDEMVDHASAYLVAHGFVSPGDKFVAIYGAPVGVIGTTNAIRVRVVE